LRKKITFLWISLVCTVKISSIRKKKIVEFKNLEAMEKCRRIITEEKPLLTNFINNIANNSSNKKKIKTKKCENKIDDVKI
jgi:phage terminase large subunit-like protein